MTSSVYRKPAELEAPKKEGGNRRAEVLTMSFVVVVVVFWNVLVCWGLLNMKEETLLQTSEFLYEYYS